jgi:peroxiredoxin Q/BCP
MNSPPSCIVLNMKITLAFVLLSLCFATMMIAADVPAEGSKAPDFTLKSQDGTPVSLHDFKGKYVVLYFYPKDMTTGCTIEAHGVSSGTEKSGNDLG